MSSRLQWIRDRGYVKENGAIKNTISTTFILPMLSFNKRDFVNQGENFLINCYIKYNIQNPEVVLCLLNDKKNSKLKAILEYLPSSPNFLELNYDDNNQEVVIFFKVPTDYYEDFYRILDGKYSEISERYKQILTSIYGTNRLYNTWLSYEYDVIYPSDEKRKAYASYLNHNNWWEIKEVLSRPDFNYEIYRTIEELKVFEKYE